MVKKENILVTGSAGQLGKSIKASSINSFHNFFFKNKNELDITDYNSLDKFVKNNRINFIINCAAFTNVNKSEKNKLLAKKINHFAVENIAKLCDKLNIKLIHISTDYVFDGKKNKPYVENDITNPVNYYGFTKLAGERAILNQNLKNSLIIRTSLLYSHYGNNFVSKIIKKINSSKNFSVVNKYYSSPTNSTDLSNVILSIINKINCEKTEIYHFSNTGFCSRFELAIKINKFLKGKSEIGFLDNNPNSTKRPLFSALDSNKFFDKFNIKPKKWTHSLEDYLTEKLKLKI